MPRSNTSTPASSGRKRPVRGAKTRSPRAKADHEPRNVTREPRRSYAFTVLLTLILFLALGSSLTLLDYSNRLNSHAQALSDVQQKLDAAQQSLSDLQNRVNPTMSNPGVVAVKPSTPVPANNSTSPGGLLNRGSLSPDGTKYAGYDDTTAGKKGIGVEILADGKVKHIVIFSRSESSGAGTAQASDLSVRWKSNSVIQYDVLVTKSGKITKETQDVQIFW